LRSFAENSTSHEGFMTLRLTDRRLASLYATFEQRQATDSTFRVGLDQALQVLAELGDANGRSAAKVLAELKQPGRTPQEQVALVKKGLSRAEKADLTAVLDHGGVTLSPEARAFFEQVLDRAPATPAPIDGLEISGDQRDGLAGRTRAGATIEAINVSASPTGRLHLDDTMVVGTADASGRFSLAKLTGDQAMREGDLVRMRARYADGSTSDWVTVKAHGLDAKDTRNAEVALFRIGLTDAGNGRVSVANINASRQISEPGAQLRFTNLRSGEKTDVTLDATGGFPAGLSLSGKAGDSFSVAASDGANNTSFAELVGNVTVPGGGTTGGDLVPDPAPHQAELNSDGTSKYAKVRFTGPLFLGGPAPEDVEQGQLGDCYFPAAMSAIAKANPDAITKLIKDNGDGTYTVTFKERDWATGQAKDVPIIVDADLYARASGGALYGHGSNSTQASKMELWFPLVEKAYAQWKGSYDRIGRGGHVSDVFEAVLGVEANTLSTSEPDDTVWNTIVTAVDAHKPVGAGTWGEDESAKYTNTGVYADHAYSVLGYETSGAERYVILRNPWGESEPADNGINDGVFRLELRKFTELYQTVHSVP
jgi:hypothetical protein